MRDIVGETSWSRLKSQLHRSAGACPPRALDCADASTGEGQALALRCGGGVFFIVARGPVPRDANWLKTEAEH